MSEILLKCSCPARNCIDNEIDNPSELARYVSDRHFGIGSDGLIMIRRSDKADFMMDMYNADGSQGRMCGNGIRCVGKYVFDHGLTDKRIITVETLSGIKTLNLSIKSVNEVEGYMGVSNNHEVVSAVTVNMGAPIFEPEQVPVQLSEGYAPKKLSKLLDINPVKDIGMNSEERVAVHMPIIAEDAFYYGTCVSMGNPHLVIYLNEPGGFTADSDHFSANQRNVNGNGGSVYFRGLGITASPDDELNAGINTLEKDISMIYLDEGRLQGLEKLSGLDIEKVGPFFENHRLFPERINTEFVHIADRKHLIMRVWERGSGETFACGTGACAVAVSSILNGYADDEVIVTLLGGNLKIRWDRQENIVFMTGPATTVFEGEI